MSLPMKHNIFYISCFTALLLTACHNPMPPNKPMFYSFNGTKRIKDLPSTHIPEVDEDVSPHGGPALDVKAVAAKKKEQENSKPPRTPPLP